MAAGERIIVAQPIASAAGRVIASPFQFYTTGEDNLRIVSQNSLAGVRLKLQGRVTSLTGVIGPSSWDHVPNSDRSSKTDEFPLGVGALLNLVVFCSAGTPVIGQTFVSVQLIRGFGAAAIVLGTLLQGYVTSRQALAWPGSPITSSVEGLGFPRSIVGSTPAAGAEISETVPTGARWELISVRSVLTTSAAVANRIPILLLTPTVNLVSQSWNTTAHTASLAGSHTWSIGVTQIADATNALWLAPMPGNLNLLPGGKFSTLTLGIQAADQWANPTYKVREWLEVS